MSETTRFDRHVFISYAHIDNQPLSPEQQGWVSRFHTSLEAMLSMRLGRKAEIWRDQKLTGNDVFSDEIVSRFTGSAVLVSVLSPRYIESDWCTREIREFCAAAERSATLVVNNKARVIKVIKTPIDSEAALPAVATQVLGYPFFIVDQDETPIELDPVYGPDLAQKYNLKVAKLAWDIAQMVKSLQPAAAGQAATNDPSKPAVYLAECSYDRREAREAIETELRMHHHTVLPEVEMPRDEEAYSAQVDALLRRCDLSVHLVGGLYGTVPDGPSEKSVVVLQNERAVMQSRERGLRRIIWIPDGTEPRSDKQREFIGALHATADAQLGADLITGDIEVVKSIVRSALRRVEAPPAPKRSDAGLSTTLLYLICDAADRKATLPLRRVLQQAGFDVQIPLFAGDAATVRRAHEDLLAECQVVLVYYGAGDEAWKRTVESDLRKAQGSRKERAPSPRVTYLAPPMTDDKAELIELGDVTVLNGLDGSVAPDAIVARVAAMRGV